MMDSVFSLEGKTVVVTGAAQGIGRAIVDQALAAGANVAAVDLKTSQLQPLLDAQGSHRILLLQGSVADPAFAEQAVAAAVAQFGAVDGLVNNAGITRPAMIDKMTLSEWQQVIDVHLSGSFFFLQAVGRHLIARAKAAAQSGGAAEAPRGAIVNISSDAGRRGTIGQINYSSAKAGVLGLTMSAAREWGRYNIRVNTVGFGVVETPMTEVIRSEKFADTYKAQIPLGRWAQADEVARPVCFLLSDAASYINGQHISVNGGYTIGM